MTEHEQAKAFREGLRLTRKELGELTGYNPQSIFLFERGRNASGQPHPPEAWQRYKMACLAVAIMRRHKVKSIEQWPWLT